MINWNWPLVNATGSFDIPNGWAIDERNWAVITASQNYVETAEQMIGTPIDYAQIQEPNDNATPAEIAWHFHLTSLTSGYMYYGTSDDMEVKQTVACNIAVNYSKIAIHSCKNCTDLTPPSIWYIMRNPYNPGGYGMGSQYNYVYTKLNTTFYM